MDEPAHNLDNVMAAIELLGTVVQIGHKNSCAAVLTTARRWSNCAAAPPAWLWPTNACRPTPPDKSC